MKISADWYHYLLKAFSGTLGKQSRVECLSLEDVSAVNIRSCKIREQPGNDLIGCLEVEIAQVNQNLVWIPRATIFSLSDDYFRMSSQNVSDKTNLRVVNNPSKLLAQSIMQFVLLSLVCTLRDTCVEYQNM